jgi:hydrogenase expression/formation protein HypE
MSQPAINMQLHCPMPKLDFEIVTLGHGSGGQLTNQLLDKVIFEALHNPLLDRRDDGAVLHMNGNIAFTTDSFVVSPIFFPGGNIGELALNGTVNDLAMSGAVPQYLSLSFIIEEGLRMDALWDILQSIKKACMLAGVQVVTGDTKVVERGKGDQIFINTSGIGAMHPKADLHVEHVNPGDKVIISGPIATHGMAIMSVREGLEFGTSLESDTRSLHEGVHALLDEFGDAIRFFRDPTRGGVASTVNELARDASVGIQLHNRHIPVLDEVKAACELLGLDPLYVANEGVFVAVVAADKAEAACELLRSQPGYEQASIVGEIVDEHPGQVVLHSGIGGRRIVHMLVGEQLPRIC